MILNLILLILLINPINTLKCMISSPSNCLYNSTCIYKEKECKGNSLTNIRGGIYCSTLIKMKSNEIYIGNMDCMYDQETTKSCKNQSQCIMKLTRKNDSYLHCCCDQPFCNQHFLIQNLTEIESMKTNDDEIFSCKTILCLLKTNWIFVLLIICGIILLLIFFLFIYRKCLIRSREKLSNLFSKRKSIEKDIDKEENGHLIDEIQENKNISINHIQFGKLIKKGKFSMIYQGFYQNNSIAIKTLSDLSLNNEGKKLFLNEKQIYSSSFMEHENILKYYGYSIDKDKYYLLTELSLNGSLRDVLRLRLLNNEEELFFLLKGISNGLEYLHRDFRLNNSRSSIAHRDLKSDNILYINNQKIVLCDFAMSIQLDQNQNYPNEQQQIGTPRYMSPELLSGTIGYETNALLKCDIYALGIIFWEILSRFPFKDEISTDYELPFENELRQRGLNITPSINEMLQIIHLEYPNNRPLIKKIWKENSKFKSICSTIEECWDQNPEGRISAPLVALRMLKLI
ncbi:hypothetical protein I4U23_021798 [Adineta vaga]|nr:hypothetical protein I4U23_021798 [Adineta vaga]